MLDFGREITGNAALSTAREWLVTNGIGGYASGTVANLLTRRYHGLLVAALKPPLGRTLMLAKLDETVTSCAGQASLFTNQWNHGGAALSPPGFLHLERFHLEGGVPVWTYAVGDALLEKRIWMQQGANRTYVRYRLLHATCALHLQAKAMVNYRDFHGNTHAGDWRMQVEMIENGLRIEAYPGASPLFLQSDRGQASYEHIWYRNFYLAAEAARGLDAREDHLYAGSFSATLSAGDALTVVAGTDATPRVDGAAAYQEKRAHEQLLRTQSGKREAPDWVQQLVLAADQFIVKRATPHDADGRSILAGYHWFSDWGRDTMISLPGLTLSTGRPADAAKILRTYGRFVDRGMLPNRFPDAGEAAEYNTADATLWYFQAMKSYHDATGDDELLQELYPILQEIIDWHQRGTRYNIHVDPKDGLLHTGEAGVQLTWMDAKVGDWVVTPRTGKAIEINALWYNALCLVRDFAIYLGRDDAEYQALAGRVRQNFGRFWHPDAGYCYDVLETPTGAHDCALRPNQLLAISLPHSPLPLDQQRQIVDVCGRELLTSLGLRSLARRHHAYRGTYSGAPHERDGAYHQGTAWGWLIGPFIEAHLRVYDDVTWVQMLLQAFARHLADHGVGSLSEISEGDAPHRPDGCIAQAWSVAEVLRMWDLIDGRRKQASK